MSEKITRRTLAAMVAAIPTAAQQPTATPADQELEAAVQHIRSNAEQIDKVALPITVEPAIQFRAL